MKKILLVFIILVLIAGAILVYFLYFSDKPKPTGDDTDPQQVINVPIERSFNNAVPEGLEDVVPRILTNSDVFDFALTSDNSIFYVNPEGQILKVGDSADQEELVATLRGTALSRADFSPNGEKVLFEFGEGEKFFRIFTIVSRSWRALPDDTLFADWSYNGESIAFFKKNPSGGADLYTLALGGGEAKKTTITLPIKNAVIEWADANNLFVFDKPSGLVKNDIWLINLKTEKIKKFADMSSGQTVKWNPLFSYGLKFSREDGALIIDSSGNTLLALGPTILPDKCFLEEATIYCGTGEGMDRALLPDDYWMRAIYSRDKLISIGIGQEVAVNASLIGLIGGNYPDIYKPKVKDSHIYFINRYDSRLYSLELKTPSNN